MRPQLISSSRYLWPFVATAAVLTLLALSGVCGTLYAADSANAFLGNWALTIPGDKAGWLGVCEKDGKLQASVLWGGGSVLPVAKVELDGDQLLIVRTLAAPAAKKKPANAPIEIIAARASGDTLSLTQTMIKPQEASGNLELHDALAGGKVLKKVDFTGKRTPPLPPAPDLSKVQFGPAIVLFNGQDLTGWKPVEADRPNGWSVQEGLLTNRIQQEKGKPHKAFANLRTEQEFEDFNLTLETRVPENGNSGIYLRGIYEVQVCESYGKPLNCHNMGAVYSRICPTVAAEKPAGQWQSFDITLVDRYVTVVLNGVKIIDNQPIEGCTGGALWSDQFRPGPIMLQGDHTSIEYRNIQIRPVVK